MKALKPHNTPERYRQGCRCKPCHDAINLYHRIWRQARASKAPKLLAADRCREHLQQFPNTHQAAAVLEVQQSTLWRIREGKHKRVTPRMEQKILSLSPEVIVERLPFVMADGTFVSADRTRALIDELREEGFTLRLLGKRLGLSRQFRFTSNKIRAWNQMRVQKFYDAVMAEAA